MIEFLLVSVALRFLLFEHYSFKWFRLALGKIFFFAPGYWQALESCAYCNGFWVSLLSYLLVLEAPHQLANYFRMLIFGLVGSWSNYFIQLKLNIVEAHPANVPKMAHSSIRIPLTKTAMMKLALSLQELSQDEKEGFVSLEEIKLASADGQTLNIIFTKAE